MKISSQHHTLLLYLVISSVTMTSTLSHAADATNAPDAKPPMSAFDNDEMMQLQKARAQVLAANPDLKAEEEKLKARHDAVQAQNPPPTNDQRNADFAEWKAYQKKMRTAMLKIDPTLTPLFAKLDSARKHGSPAPFSPAPAK